MEDLELRNLLFNLQHALEENNRKQDAVLAAVRSLKKLEATVMATLDELVAATEEQTTVEASMEVFLQGLKDQLTAQGLDQAKVDAAFAGVTANTARISAAISANTTSEPPTEPPVV
jgi:membrane-bound lytic murein transglycosylase B